MIEYIDLALTVQIFVLLNPMASFPFLMTAYKRKANVQSIAIKAVLTAFAIAVTMTLIGPALFGLFGITLDSFRIAGGVILFILGINMVKPKKAEDHDVEGLDSLITIIATPMLTGPGVISFITVKSYEVGQASLLMNMVGSFVLVGLVFYIFSTMVSKVNPKLVDMISRIMGLFLTAVAIEMMAKGLTGIILALK